MLTIINKNGTRKSFNLKSQDRERALLEIWNDEPVESSKKIRIAADDGESFIVCFNEIESLNYEDCYFARGTVHVKEDKGPPPKEDPYAPFEQMAKARERRNVEAFLNNLKKHGCTPNPNDPLFQDTLNKVRRM